jgi:putative DNA primase/helicase
MKVGTEGRGFTTPLNFDSIPVELKAYPNWVLWKLEERNGMNTKIPYQINGTKADTTNSNTWVDYNSVEQASSSFSGIGFVFTETSGIIGIDWDHARDSDTEEWNQEVLQEIKSCGSYAEISQSGTGAHVLIKGKIPGDRRRTGNIEMYSKDHFFVVTGQHLEGTPQVIKENQEAINRLYKKHFEDTEMVALKKSDETILKQCRTNKKFSNLFIGDTSDYENDESRADLALCGILAKHTQDRVQIDRLFRRSGLYREKWERDDYRNSTIDKALKGNTEVCKGEKSLKVSVPFDVVGDHILQFEHVFTMRDNDEIYLYQDGVYRSDGVESILGTKIRNLHNQYYADQWLFYNPGVPLNRIPKATVKYVSEALAYIRAYSHVKRADIDADQDRYINFKNGFFDLQEWKLIDHTPKIRSIAQVPVIYDPKATCPVISKYFEDCELPEESIKVLTKFAGYSLTNFVWIQKALMLHGNGANGKSVFINLLKIILGNDYVSGESLQKLEEDKYRVANLYGKRLNAFPDLKDTPLQTNEVFNILTGNDLMLVAERKYQNSFSFKPTAKLLFSANKIPFAYSDNYAYYRRWILINFLKTFEKDEIDDKILEKMTTEEEKSGFINLMLEGLKRVIANRKYSYDLGVEKIQRQYTLR